MSKDLAAAPSLEIGGAFFVDINDGYKLGSVLAIADKHDLWYIQYDSIGFSQCDKCIETMNEQVLAFFSSYLKGDGIFAGKSAY